MPPCGSLVSIDCVLPHILVFLSCHKLILFQKMMYFGPQNTAKAKSKGHGESLTFKITEKTPAKWFLKC